MLSLPPTSQLQSFVVGAVQICVGPGVLMDSGIFLMCSVSRYFGYFGVFPLGA